MNVDLIAGYQKIVSILLVILVGYILKRKKIITDEFQIGLTNLLLRVILPFSILYSFSGGVDVNRLKTSLVLLGIAFIFYPLMDYAFTKIVYLNIKDVQKRRLFALGTTYANSLFVGYPFIQAIFGLEGVFYASIFNLPFNIYNWSTGVANFSGVKIHWKELKEILKNPIIMACIGGYLWWLLQGVIPSQASPVLKPIWDVFQMIGSASTPISMMIIGAMLADSKLSIVFKDIEVWYFCFIKLMIVPAFVLGSLYLCGFKSWILIIPTLLTAMPMGASAGIIAAKFNIKKELAATLITFSTLLCAITVPMWIIIILHVI